MSTEIKISSFVVFWSIFGHLSSFLFICGIPGNYTFSGLHCMHFLQVRNFFFLCNCLVEFKLTYRCISLHYILHMNLTLLAQQEHLPILDNLTALFSIPDWVWEKKGFKFVELIYSANTIIQLYSAGFKCLPEKLAYISWCNDWFPCEITSEKRAQKSHADDASLLRGYCFWLAETNFPMWHDQSKALLRSG